MGEVNDRAFPILIVHDVPAVRDFYARLGFVQTYQFPPQGEPAFVSLERGASSIGLGARSEADEDRFGYWVYVHDVDAAFEELRSAGAPVVGEPRDEPW